jgi:hypothetical protein
MIISVTLFSIIIIFLYQTLDITKKSNKIYKEELNKILKAQDIKKLFFEDMLNAKNIQIYSTENENMILSLETSNTFHNSFYINILYIVSKENNLIRVESLEKYDNKKEQKFINNQNIYVDKIKINVELFNIYQNKKVYTIYIKTKDKKETIVSINTL